ncbi:MAG: TiaS agmantine-binding domain-containing protein [Candidatus Hodarchaeales archaeon]|jgi:tRNA(Ile2)-agmatinylcytidine synthase
MDPPKEEIELHLAFDDTDSLEGMCTTYLGFQLVKILSNKVTFLDLPWLIRLNPNIPFKTRGNGAVCLHLLVARDKLEDIKGTVIEQVTSQARIHDADRPADPGIVFKTGIIPPELVNFSRRALHDLIPLEDALSEVARYELEVYHPGKGLGVTGALAALGYPLNDLDHTYELIAYRSPDHQGPRRITKESIEELARKYREWTFSSLDETHSDIKITPRGKDPVLCGIRGENVGKLLEAFQGLTISEPVQGITIFKTNQATDQHHEVTPVKSISKALHHQVVDFKGKVITLPKQMVGGHAYFDLDDGSGIITCFVYEPAREFRRVVMELQPGDELEVWGGIRPADLERGLNSVLNVEKIDVLALAPVLANPHCPDCDKSLTSKGKNKGFYCKRCGGKYPDWKKVVVKSDRVIQKGRYLPPIRSQRHLSKPFQRYGREKNESDDIDVESVIVDLMSW